MRCSWAGDTELYQKYHDDEWGVPLHDDGGLFEFLLLEGAQAGLSWETILKKRDNYRKAFDRFNARKIAKYDEKKIQALLQDAGIVRNKLKVRAFVTNAQVFLRLQKEHGSFDAYIWQFAPRKKNSWKRMEDIPAMTDESDAMSKALKKEGMTFVGSTICYAFMQATGMVNDHVTGCFRYTYVNNK